jgi:diguanylate cyclase (GGDEF)-like protein
MNIVIIDDAKVNAKLISAYVEKLENSKPTIFTNAVEGLDYCIEEDVDIILVDYKMPNINGLELVKKIRSIPEKSGVPIVMITAEDNRDILRQALDAGANDFLTKPVDEIELTARVRNMLSLRAYALELKHMATIDALTSTYNRRHFLEESEREFSRSQRYDTSLSVLMLDADKFKLVNDTYGHAVGDTVLAALGDICRSELRENDFIGRMGGEEFAICLTETSKTSAQEVAERLREAIECTPITTERNVIYISISIGFTEVLKTDQIFSSALDRADRALYRAKKEADK